MNAFRIAMGKCEACEDASAQQGIGALCCNSCGAIFRKLCSACAAKPCPRCKGELAAFKSVFPHSAFAAISDGEPDRFESVIRANRSLINDARNESGETLLHRAVRAKGKGVATQMCRFLLNLGMRHDAVTDCGRTALQESVRHRVFNKDVADLLRSSVNSQDKDGRTALMFAAEGAGLFGSRKGNIAIARELLALGANPEIHDKRGVTALGYAMASNDTDRNGDMIALLERAMVAAAAMQEFNNQYSFTFDNKTGGLILKMRK